MFTTDLNSNNQQRQNNYIFLIQTNLYFLLIHTFQNSLAQCLDN